MWKLKNAWKLPFLQHFAAFHHSFPFHAAKKTSRPKKRDVLIGEIE